VHNDDRVPQVTPECAYRQFLVQHPPNVGGSHCSPASIFPFPQTAGGAPGGFTIGGRGGGGGAFDGGPDLPAEVVDLGVPAAFDIEGDAAID